jgi:HSP20 family protein
MSMTRFDPFREFTTLQDRMNRLFGDVYLRDQDVIQRGSWVPPVDIFETEGHDLVIKAELPDMTREAIEVTVENNR